VAELEGQLAAGTLTENINETLLYFSMTAPPSREGEKPDPVWPRSQTLELIDRLISMRYWHGLEPAEGISQPYSRGKCIPIAASRRWPFAD
jgi:hypothetical protein